MHVFTCCKTSDDQCSRTTKAFQGLIKYNIWIVEHGPKPCHDDSGNRNNLNNGNNGPNIAGFRRSTNVYYSDKAKEIKAIIFPRGEGLQRGCRLTERWTFAAGYQETSQCCSLYSLFHNYM
jgi:hypothetical protein